MRCDSMLLCIALGFLPFVFGGIMNWWMMTNPDTLPPYLLIALGMLILWAVISFFMMGRMQHEKKVVLSLNGIAFVVLILLGVQEMVLQAYWMNPLGAWTQYFYLPLLRLGFTFTSWTPSMFFAYIASFLLMLGASILGCNLKKNR